jgi:putative cardiolipin synthase
MSISAEQPIATTTLASAVAAAVRSNPGKSGVRLLADGIDAFAARIRSARCAQRTLDVQTYVWRDDVTERLSRMS